MKKTLLMLTFGIFPLGFSFAQDKKMAEDCFNKQDYKCAEEQYLKLAEKEQIQRYQSDYYNQLGTSQRRLGKFSQAIKSYENALKSNPQSASVYANLGSIHYQKGSKPKALEYLNTGLKLEAENVDMYLTRAKVYESLGKKDLAEKDYQQILTFDAKNILARSGLAHLKKRNNDLEGSLKDFNALIAEKPESLLYTGRADVYFKQKKYKEALADVNKSITIDPKFSQSYVLKAQILLSTNKEKEACLSLDKAVAAGYEKLALSDLYTRCGKK